MRIQFFVSLIIGIFCPDQITVSALNTEGELAVSANEFLKSIGVCVHVQPFMRASTSLIFY